MGRKGGGEDPQVDKYIAGLKPPLKGTVEALRRLVLEAAPDLREGVKWGNPTYLGKDKVCYIAALDRYVLLGFFRGADLLDPKGLLEGTGKKMRHVKVSKVEPSQAGAYRELLREAVTLDSAP